MLTIHPSARRGNSRFSWLDSYHSFSFGEYYNPQKMGFGPLRVINEDFVAAGAGFGTHGHKDMEIITYVIKGAVAHRDSLGHDTIIPAGDFQKMSAGTGIEHSEFNPSKTDAAHFLQIWIMPDKRGVAPNYSQISVLPNDGHNQLRKIASGNPSPGIIPIHQDADLYLSRLDSGKTVDMDLNQDRLYWVHAIDGGISVNGEILSAGDSAAIERESKLSIAGSGGGRAEFLLFDLPE